MAVHHRLETSEIGEVTVVRFVDRKILDESNIQDLGQELFQLRKPHEPVVEFYQRRIPIECRLGQVDHPGQEGQGPQRAAEALQHPP